MLKNKDRIVRCYDSYTNIDLLKMEAKRAIKVQLIDNKILFTDNKSRNRTFYYFDLLEILRA